MIERLTLGFGVPHEPLGRKSKSAYSKNFAL